MSKLAKAPYNNYRVVGISVRNDGRTQINLQHLETGKRIGLTYARYVLGVKIGRELYINEEAHHVDGDVSNDNPENLEVKDKTEHRKHHKKYSDKEMSCPACGDKFKYTAKQQSARNRSTTCNKEGLVFCSRKCSSNYAFNVGL